ncbi:radical SAM protein [Celeribacter neptunius]|uniref:4Fe-4S single cluster domain-containing protein n=1 Tax=Celeribacter neptunius TaxID=588602 RepID=A0A1I3KNZ7_9RHOB|nr:radical SAM protein [Celeribacter neptunius]SFI74232.1 4Fe-4S single cluster domain-containing protein [Celeribacter neptunius]
MTVSCEQVSRYGEHIAISVTNSCPLQCAHCISGSAPDTARGASGLIEAFDALLARWPIINHVTFTGGEPFHHPEELAEFAARAKARGVRYGVITGAFWGKSERSCDRYLKAVPDLATMTVSTDLYHQQFVTHRHVLNVVKAARKRGIHVKVRFTHADPMPEAERAVEAALKADLRPEELEYAPLQKYGRAVEQGIGRSYDRWSPQPRETKYGICPSTGPHIFENGRVMPCCNTIVSLRDTDIPLDFGNAITEGVPKVQANRAQNTFWLAIKVLGFDWLKDRLSELNPAYAEYAPINACDFCFDGCKPGGIRDDIARLMADPSLALYVHSVAAEALGEMPDIALLSGFAAQIRTGRAESGIRL